MDKEQFAESVQGGWVAWLQHYFVTAGSDQGRAAPGHDPQGRPGHIVGFTGPTLSVPAGSKVETDLTLYAGPKPRSTWKELSRPGTDRRLRFPLFIAQPIFWLLQHIHSPIGNWGWSIIALTVLIKLAFFPLSAASYRSMARMRAVSPKMQAIKEQHGDDRQKMSQAMMELYKKEKINPPAAACRSRSRCRSSSPHWVPWKAWKCARRRGSAGSPTCR